MPLQFLVDVFENGKFKEELLKTWGELETKYNDSLISFGVINNIDEVHSLKLLSGIPSGLVTTFYPNNMTMVIFPFANRRKNDLRKK